MEVVVIGAGVVGLACAAAISRRGHHVVVIERHRKIGQETSSRSSGVIHAGIYYPTESLKARLCVAGRDLLYRFCRERGVKAKRIGKLIVAVNEAETGKLEVLYGIAGQNGVHDLAWLSPEDVAALEPDVRCARALLSPSTGIVDSHAFMLSLQGEAEACGATVALSTSFRSATIQSGAMHVTLGAGDGEDMVLACRNLVNCAGHGAHAVARAISGLDPSLLPPRFLAKGNYCAVSGRSPFSHLVYPMPVAGALGVHVTLDLNGAVRLGPDIEWVDDLDYRVSPTIAEPFRGAVATYWPGVVEHTLTPSYSGIRPKIHGPGAGFADFRIDGPEHHGVLGLVNLFGIESPGLTSSLAIGAHVAALLGSKVASM